MQSWPSLLTGSAGFLFVWIAIFFLYLLTAPYRTEREAHDTLKSSDAFKAYQRAIDILGIESSFTLSEAACLLARQEIVRSDPKGVASFFITRIKQAIVDGSIGSNVPKSTIDLIKAQRMMAGFGGQTQVAELPDDAMISKKTLLALSAKYDVPLL
ncbi:hypothetical protein BCL32_1017 [Rhizobium mongolense USDA 1844]|nr:hypothetical protein BCL32_1017 [Rhizobium mongolense USDA 1844]